MIQSPSWHNGLFCCITANNSELTEKLEELLVEWSKQIEQVLAESEQIRREADDIGPSAELAYWKTRMAKFNTYGSTHIVTHNLLNISIHFNSTQTLPLTL